ncbi:glycoside hydrolase family 13 protein [Bacillota bacterium LX-D]|nr:glycoside hydrolase family 13 protein [Bacillota bacterium LX-D]
MNKIHIFHNSHDAFYRLPFGAVPCETKILLQIEVTSVETINNVYLRVWKSLEAQEEKIPMVLAKESGQKKIYQAQVTAPPKPNVLWYYFMLNVGDRTYYYGNNVFKRGGIGQIWQTTSLPSYQITVYKKDFTVPQWFKEGIMYQIFVDRFYNGGEDGKFLDCKKNSYFHSHWDETPFYMFHPYTGKVIGFDYFGGNLQGISQKLSYLKELNINTIYLNPIFEAASNHKYDTGDYKKVDSMYGTEKTLHALCTEAKKLGINLILDGVFSHTGSDSIYFNKEGSYPSVGAYQSPNSIYFSWYRFGKYPTEYECWWNVDTLPNVNELEPSYLEYIITGEDSVLKHWMRQGVKGWRLDVADELPDEFIQIFRKTLKEIDKNAILIGEVWEDASNKISYDRLRQYLWGDELDSIMNYPFRNITIDFALGRKDATSTHLALMQLYENYPLEHFYANMNLLGGHDVARILTVLGEAPPEHTLSKAEKANYKLPPEKHQLAVKRLKLLTLWQMTFPGIPCIYYGDEAGLEGYSDPFNRAPYPWGKENYELLNWYKQITTLRSKNDALKTGKWICCIAQGDIYGYLRTIEEGKDVFGQKKQNQTFLVLFNRNTEQKINVKIDVSQWCSGKLRDVLKYEIYKPINGSLDITLAPLEGKLLLEEAEV